MLLSSKPLKILHTSDWHLGRALYGKKRYEEFAAFLGWLVDTIEQQEIDILLVAGDVFDTTTPSNRAQELYYDFLIQLSSSCCQHVVIIGGNHDSPSFLNAPKKLLRALDVHVVAAVSDALEDEVLVLKNNDIPSAIVCAVPYLRDKDIRTIEAGETIDDKNLKLVEGIKNHYAEVALLAERKQQTLASQGFGDIPIIGMGHLFTSGGATIDGDGVRELYVGTLVHLGKEVFPSSFDYLALGHLHSAQMVGKCPHLRFCGSPIPMGFGEAKQEKKVLIITFQQKKPEISEIVIPCFQALAQISGSFEQLCLELEQLKSNNDNIWLELNITEQVVIEDMRRRFDEITLDSKIDILRIKNKAVFDKIIHQLHQQETLDDLTPDDVFNRCLDAFDVPSSERADLLAAYHEIIRSINEDEEQR